MSNEFRPGHPFVFWLAMVVLAYAAFSGVKAGVTINDCGEVDDQKAWVVFPPKWKCGEHGVKITDSD